MVGNLLGEFQHVLVALAVKFFLDSVHVILELCEFLIRHRRTVIATVNSGDTEKEWSLTSAE